MLTTFLRLRPGCGTACLDERALAQVWKAERFSWGLTILLHTFPNRPFDAKMQLAELVFKSRPAITAFAENYLGLPI